ncbi:ABC transporter permease [Gordonia rhizosphera]|uniref:ABC transporter permease protein n=1 Tax=Gordonia rhizosphera NBRC 16068 TaxID=1108045 RepID=K6WD78_9ACTN|nr:ABC transporter permease [Gordonia rhizosphera]GAB91686.1 hypothetical protein GORHZ_141_00610 [Gordonia rhizosphera NBRC 16068]
MTTLHRPQSPAVERDAAPIPLSRLTRVELRKLVDTRAGFWLAASVGVISAIVVIAMLIADRESLGHLNFIEFFAMMNIPISTLLPVMAILLVTSEWSQRNALTTFTMEPRRERILLAKLGVALIAGIAAVVVSLTFGAVANVVAGLIYGDPAGSWEFTAAALINSFTLQMLWLLVGFGFAALILNTPGAIVAYFALPTAMSLLSELVPWFKTNLAGWVDLTTTGVPFQSGDWAAGGEWSRLTVSAVIWVAIPLTLGVIRVLHTEVK